MTKPAAFSFTSISDFVSCPRKYHEVRVLKKFKDDQNAPHLVWGRDVHTAFEKRQRDQTPLPASLAHHEPFMQRLDKIPGKLFVEQKIALNTKLQPCGYFDADCFYRGVLDWVKIDLHTEGPYARATLVDYKTGKVNPKWRQHMLHTLWVFAKFGESKNVKISNCMFYWTQDPDNLSRKVWGYGEIDLLWKELLPDLKQYKQAWKEDLWQPRKNGLCRNYCPVKSCEFNGR